MFQRKETPMTRQRIVRDLIRGSVAAFLLLLPLAHAGLAAGADGQITWAVPISITPGMLDPGDHQGSVTSLLTFYALHDALVKPMPGAAMAPSLAESWSVTPDGLVYEFVLRKNVRFHNGDPMTPDDVKFSFERYRGAWANLLRDKVAGVEIVDPSRVRFRLREAWPDFMTFFATPATGAAWIVPRDYVRRVGDSSFAKAPVGAGPYRLVAFTPGVELILEAHDGFWRKRPAVKRLVFRSVPDDSTRLAMLKRGDVDIAYNLRGPLAEEVQRTPGLALTRALLPITFWMGFTAEPWDPGSPWHDRRVRLAASLAIDRQAINQAETLGFSRITASIVPAEYEFAWPAPPIPYDPAQAKRLLAEAGVPNGFDAGEYTCDSVFASLGEAVINYLGAVGIRARLRLLERAALVSRWQDKKIRHLAQGTNSAFGNAATRIERDMVTAGAFAFGSYPEIDSMFQRQGREPDRAKREALLHAIQRLAYERVMFAPIFQLAQLNGVRARVEQPAIGLIDGLPYSSPYEELRLRP
jgi:peptide/nickel transport system substrate-binding protein